MAPKNALDKFCLDLVGESETWSRFRTDSKGLMQQADLSQEEIKLFTQGTDAELRKYLGRGPERFSAIIVKPIK